MLLGNVRAFAQKKQSFILARRRLTVKLFSQDVDLLQHEKQQQHSFDTLQSFFV